MTQYKNDLKAAIVKKYGSMRKWMNAHNVVSERFYNFLKGKYSPSFLTFERWVRSVDLEISLKKQRKKTHKQ